MSAARAQRAMVVTPQPEATDAGTEVLLAGGNAVDAAVAAALVQGVVDPLMCGVGGMAMIHVVTPDGRSTVIDGLGTSPSGVTDTMWESRLLGPTTDGFGYRVEGFVNETGPEAVMTPGTMRALAALHERFGTLPWADLFVDAIRYAREGWLVRPHVHTVMVQDERRYGRMDFGEKLGITEDGRRIYLGPEGEYPRVGQRILNPDLADTLQQLATRGAEDLYTGELATVVADSVQADGGLLSAADLAAYQLLEPEAPRLDYRGLTVAVPGAPSGGTQMLQTLGVLARFELGSLPHNGPEHLRLLAEAMKIALRDKEALWASPGATEEQFARLIGEEHLDELAEEVRSGVRADVDGPRAAVRPHESQHTTHLNAMQADGLTVALTHTLGNPSGYIPRGTGMVLNGGMSTFDPRPGHSNSISPGLRRNTTMCPTVVLDGSSPVMAIGAPGASWITGSVTQGLSNIVDFGMDAQQAVMAPRIAVTSNAVDVSSRIPRRVERALTEQGYAVRRSALTYAFAGVHAITRRDGVLEGGADPQRDGYADGV